MDAMFEFLLMFWCGIAILLVFTLSIYGVIVLGILLYRTIKPSKSKKEEDDLFGSDKFVIVDDYTCDGELINTYIAAECNVVLDKGPLKRIRFIDENGNDIKLSGEFFKVTIK